MKLCSIIIVTHNNLEYTKQCLESIISKTDYHPFELIVVDAHSTDGTLDYLSSMPEVKLVALDKNYPYSYSLNCGIKAANGEFLCFMNNDILITQPDWLTILIECALNDAKIGIVGPLFCDMASSKACSASIRGNRFSFFSPRVLPIVWGEGTQLPRYLYPDGKEYKILVKDDTITPCTYVMGACFLVKRQLIDTVGLFDEKFFFAYDETDYCARSWKAGWKVVCNSKVRVVHLVGKTMKAVTKKDYEYDTQEYENPRTRFFKKHSSKDFEMIIRQAKGVPRFYLWKIQYNIHKALDLSLQGVETIRKKGFAFFLERTQYYIFHRNKK